MTNETPYQRGYREGAEKMREDAAAYIKQQARQYLEYSESAPRLSIKLHQKSTADAYAIAAEYLDDIPITPPQPEAQDDEREMREAFERWLCEMYEPLSAESVAAQWDGERYESTVMDAQWEAYQAAWKEKSK